jgi:hypothetical protein
MNKIDSFILWFLNKIFPAKNQQKYFRVIVNKDRV